MVIMSTLEKVSPIGSLSHCMDTRDQKLTTNVGGGEQGNAKLPRSLNQNQKLGFDHWYSEPMSQNSVGGQPIGTRPSQYESTLFSSSLSDLFTHKLRLQSNDFCQSGSHVDPRWDDALPEPEARMLKNLLPDEEELFSGMVNETGCRAHAGGVADDLDDLDLFSSSGGIELEADDSWAEKRSMAFPARGASGNATFSGHHASRLPSSIRPLNASAISHQLGQENSVNNTFYSPIAMTPPGSQFGSFDQVKPDKFSIPSFHPHSLPEFHSGLSSGVPLAQSPSQIADIGDIYVRAAERMSHDMHQVGSNGRDMELNNGAFAYSSNGNRFYAPHQSLASGPSSYEHHPLRIYSPSVTPFVNGEHPHHAVQLPGFPRGQHLMLDMISSPDLAQHPVGSAPVINASHWDRQLMHAGLSPEASTFHSRAMKNGQIPGCSPMHPLAYNMYPQANGTSMDVAKSNGLQSPQQICPVLPRRSTMSGSFGSPMDRVRNRRYEASSNYADRKHYELKIDRILRGEDSRTTLMIKNIPNKYTSKMLLATIDEQHRGTYDFIYLPIDFKNKCNVGYAFINMVNPLHVVSFHQTFEGKKWEKFNSEKVATLAYARIQGKTALIAHFQNSSLMNEDKRCRPILFHTVGPNAGDQEPFPMGTNIRSRPGKLRTHGGDEDFEIRGQLKSWSSSGCVDEASDEADY